MLHPELFNFMILNRRYPKIICVSNVSYTINQPCKMAVNHDESITMIIDEDTGHVFLKSNGIWTKLDSSIRFWKIYTNKSWIIIADQYTYGGRESHKCLHVYNHNLNLGGSFRIVNNEKDSINIKPVILKMKLIKLIS